MKPDKNILIDYLYGEISDEKRLEIELYFSQNPTEKIHLEALKNTQNILLKLKDKTPKQPLVLMDLDSLATKNVTKNIAKNKQQNGQQNQYQNVNTTQNQPFFNAFTRNFMGVAACLAFLFFSAYLTGFSVRQTDKGFEVAFGKKNQNNNQNQQQQPQLQASDEQINQIVKNNQNDNQNDKQIDSQKDTKFMENFINQKMKEKTSYYEQELSTLKMKAESQMNNSLVNNSKANTNGTFSNKEVQEMLKQVREQDFEMMRGFIAANNAQQSEYVNSTFKSFAEYFEGKRQQDLSAIGNSISTFKDEAKEKFKENDIILTRLTAK